MFPIKHCKPNDWNCRENDIITLVEYVIEYWSATEET